MQTKNIDISISGGRASSLMVSSQDSQRLAVLFPGAGYGTDKPLFYYVGRLAQAHGCDVLKLNYGNIDWGRAIAGDEVTLGMAVDSCLRAMENAAVVSYTELIFISKSFGTVVAGEVEKQQRARIKQLFLTPLGETFPYLSRHGREAIVIAGGRDGIIAKETLVDMAQRSGTKFYIFDDANHSLEVEGDPLRSIEVLYETTEIMSEFLS